MSLRKVHALDAGPDKKKFAKKFALELISGAFHSLRLFLWASLAMVFVFLILICFKESKLQREFRGEKLLQARYETSLYCMRNHALQFERFWCHQIEAGYFFLDFPLISFFLGFYFFLYVKLSICQSLTLLVGSLLFYFVQYGVIALGTSDEVQNYFLLSFGVMIMFPMIAFKLTRPRDCQMWKAALGITLFGILGAQMIATFRFWGSENKLLVASIYIPILRELFLFPARSLTKWMYLSKSIAGTNGETRREFALLFVFILQFFLAIWVRMVVTTFNSSRDLLLYLIFNSITEVSLRLTLLQRDRLMSRALNFCISRPRWRHSSRYLLNTDPDSDTTWVANLINGEMIGEHIGVIANFGAIMIFRNETLALPLQVFADHPHPETLSFSNTNFIFQGFSQILTEFLIDAFCITYENTHLNVQLAKAWRTMRVHFRLTIITLAAMVGFSSALVNYSLSTYDCSNDLYDRGICYCDLLENSVFDLECRLLNSTMSNYSSSSLSN